MKRLIPASLYILLLLLLFRTPVRGQNAYSTAVDGPIIPSVAAMSFGKYADTPVNPANGTTSVGIPLFTLEEGPLSHALSLSYHTGGIRISEIASEVGLGWNLNAGGVISRTVRGLPDEQNDQGYWYSGDQLLGWLSGPEGEDVAKGKLDAEPDLFFFNVGGMSGKFVFDANGNAHLIPKADIKIQRRENNSALGFRLIAPDGTKYYFGQFSGGLGIAIQQTEVDGRNQFIDTWYLTRIESFDSKHKIDFEYGLNDYRYKTNKECIVSKYHDNGQEEGTNTCDGEQTTIRIDGMILKKIITTTTTVDFEHGERLDLLTRYGNGNSAGNRVSRITINHGDKCIYYDLNYTYLTDNTIEDNLDRRLRLENIRKLACNNSSPDTEEPYVFEYYGSTTYPGLLSKQIDHWGYYNGEHVNETKDDLIPSSSLRTLSGNHLLSYGSGQRESSEPHMIHGMLKRITFPTKGHTEYTYEANDYLKTDNDPQQLLSMESCFGNAGTACCPSSTTNAYQVLDSSMVNTGIIKLKLDNDLGEYDCTGTFHQVQIRIYDETNGGTFAAGFSTNISGYGEAEVIKNISDYPSLVPGHNYRFELSTIAARGTVEITYTPDFVNAWAGGLRLQKIQTHDGFDASKDIIRTFEYKQEGTTNSSGILTNMPNYAVLINAHTALFASTGVLPMSNSQGSHLTYSRVVEYLNGNGANEYLMNTEMYGPDQFPTYPARPGMHLVQNGTVKEHRVLNANGTLESSKITESYEAGPFQYTSIPGIKYAAVEVKTYNGSSLSDSHTASQYDMRTNVYRPKRIISMIDGVTTTKDYKYHSQDAVLSPVEISYTNSDGKLHQTKIRYTVDYHLTAGLKNVFIKRNMIDIPYETVEYVDGIQVDGLRTYFSNFTSLGIRTTSVDLSYFPRPYTIRKYERTWLNNTVQPGAWVLQESFLEYNPDGFLHKYQKDGWGITSYFYNADKLLVRQLYTGHETNYEYYNNSALLYRSTAVDGTTVTYTYDDLMRLKTQRDDCNNILMTYNYFTSGNLQNSKSYVEVIESYPVKNYSDVNVLRTRTYKDGLGRDIQSVRHKQSPDKKDLLSSTSYDNQGRVQYQYQQQESAHNDMRYVAPQSSWYKSTFEYYPSPLNRLHRSKEQDWYWVTQTYGHNEASDNVKFNGTTSEYAPSLLSKITMEDGSGRKQIVFKDKKGQSILSRETDNADNAAKRLDTYRLYDDKSRVTYVLPPDILTTSILFDDVYYRYQYDGKDRLTMKKVPGAEEVYFKYNSQHILGGYQDGLLRSNNQWYTYQYDNLGRETAQGFFNGTPGTSFAPTDPQITMTYGTNTYDKDKVKTVQTKILGSSTWLTSTRNYNSCGILTSESGNSHANSTAGSINTTFSYDGALNTTQTLTTVNAFGVNKAVTATQTFDRAGRPKVSYFQVDNGPNTLLSNFTYNAKEEVITNFQGETGLSGKLKYLQRIDYAYKANGLLHRINSDNLHGGQQAHEVCNPPNPADPGANYTRKDLFYLELYYDQTVSGTDAVAETGGNIANAVWQVRGREQGIYSYQYDDYNRLTRARYYDRENGTLTQSDRYTASYQYDNRGNFTRIDRNGMYDPSGCSSIDEIDKLFFTYDTYNNAIKQVTDLAPPASAALGFENGLNEDYTYDVNGNMTKHPDRQITMVYNHLNLPTTIQFTGTRKRIDFTYDARGVLLTKTVLTNNVIDNQRDYVAGMEFLKEGTGPSVIHLIPHAEGRVAYTNGGNPRYDYQLKDHLGNIRLLYSDMDADGQIETPEEVLWEGHYYPFGMQMDGPWLSSAGREARYTYNGIQHLNDHGLDVNMATYRVLDPAIGRWWQVDPETERAQGQTPYNSMWNNPVQFSDPKGDLPIAAILVGAAIGAATSGGTTIITNAIAGDKLLKGVGKAMLMGAMSGAISGGITGAVGKEVFKQSVGAVVARDLGAKVATDLAFNKKLTAGSIAESIVSSVISAGMAKDFKAFKGLKGGKLVKGAGKVLNKSVSGAIKGSMSKAFGAAVDGKNIGKAVVKGAWTGAIKGGVEATATSGLERHVNEFGGAIQARLMISPKPPSTQPVDFEPTLPVPAINNSYLSSNFSAHGAAHYVQLRGAGFDGSSGGMAGGQSNSNAARVYDSPNGADHSSMHRIGYHH